MNDKEGKGGSKMTNRPLYIPMTTMTLYKALIVIKQYCKNTECRTCIFGGDNCLFGECYPIEWDIKEVIEAKDG